MALGTRPSISDDPWMAHDRNVYTDQVHYDTVDSFAARSDHERMASIHYHCRSQESLLR